MVLKKVSLVAMDISVDMVTNINTNININIVIMSTKQNHKFFV